MPFRPHDEGRWSLWENSTRESFCTVLSWDRSQSHNLLLGLFHDEQEGFFIFLFVFGVSKEMIFALKEKDSDEMAFSANLYKRMALLVLMGWNAICSCTCINMIQWTLNWASLFQRNWVSPKHQQLTQCALAYWKGTRFKLRQGYILPISSRGILLEM